MPGMHVLKHVTLRLAEKCKWLSLSYYVDSGAVTGNQPLHRRQIMFLTLLGCFSPRPLCLSPLPLSAQLPDLSTLLLSRQVPESECQCMWLILWVCACVFGKRSCLWRKWQVMRASWWVSPSSGAPFIAVNKGPFTRRFFKPVDPGQGPALTHAYRSELSLTQDNLHKCKIGHPDAKMGTQMHTYTDTITQADSPTWAY